VIQTISGSVIGRYSPDISLSTRLVPGGPVSFFIPPLSPVPGHDRPLTFVFVQPLTAYAGPGTVPHINLSAGDQTFEAAASVTITGYLIPGSG
jgi:hypothetical protein